MNTASKVTPDAQMVSILALSMVLRRPMTSNSVPVRIRPKPLQTDKTPTRETGAEAFFIRKPCAAGRDNYIICDADT